MRIDLHVAWRTHSLGLAILIKALSPETLFTTAVENIE